MACAWFTLVVRGDAKHIRRVRMTGTVRRFPGAGWHTRSGIVVVNVDLREASARWVNVSVMDRYGLRRLSYMEKEIEAMAGTTAGIACYLRRCQREDGFIIVTLAGWLGVLSAFREAIKERNNAAAAA